MCCQCLRGPPISNSHPPLSQATAARAPREAREGASVLKPETTSALSSSARSAEAKTGAGQAATLRHPHLLFGGPVPFLGGGTKRKVMVFWGGNQEEADGVLRGTKRKLMV